MTIDVKHGWFSKKQFKQNKVIYYYKDVMGKEVALTEIKNCTDNSNFNDANYIGIVTEFIRKEDSNGDFFTINYVSSK